MRDYALSAQELPSRTDLDSATDAECAAWTPPEAAGRRLREAADELGSDARQALMLGNLERSRRLFEQASELDGSDPELHYGLGRVLELLHDREGAIEPYCRAAIDGPRGHEPHEDALQRTDSLRASLRDEVSPSARVSFERKAEAAERGDLTDAVRQFGEAEAVAPDWPATAYNTASHWIARARTVRPWSTSPAIWSSPRTATKHRP